MTMTITNEIWVSELVKYDCSLSLPESYRKYFFSSSIFTEYSDYLPKKALYLLLTHPNREIHLGLLIALCYPILFLYFATS